jgi:hypothetical protein
MDNGMRNLTKPLGNINTGVGSNIHTICKIIANINPLVSVTSAGKIFLGDGKDIHDIKADGADKALAILDIATLGSSNTLKLLPSSLVNKSAIQMSKSVSEINGFVIDLVQSIKTGADSSKKKEE